MPSLYAQFIEEIRGLNVIERPYGFITYGFQPDCVYIEELFISSDHRHSGLAKELGLEVETIAKLSGHKKLICAVQPTNKGSSYALGCYLKWGFKLNSSTNNYILLEKEL